MRTVAGTIIVQYLLLAALLLLVPPGTRVELESSCMLSSQLHKESRALNNLWPGSSFANAIIYVPSVTFFCIVRQFLSEGRDFANLRWPEEAHQL